MRSPGYTILGYLVWNGGKIYVRRRYGGAPRKIALGGLLAVGLGVALVGARRSSSSG